MKNKVVS